MQMAVKVPANDLLDPVLAGLIGSNLRQRSLPPEALLLELSQRALMSYPPPAVRSVGTLAKMGISLSLDASGTGYSSLAGLKRLPVTEIRIDSFFVERMLDSPDDRVIVQSLVSLVRALGIRSLAAGASTAVVAAALRRMGCDAVQGPHVSEPLDAAGATAWLAEHAATARPAGSAAEDGTETRAAHSAAAVRACQEPAGDPSGHRGGPPPRSAVKAPQGR